MCGLELIALLILVVIMGTYKPPVEEAPRERPYIGPGEWPKPKRKKKCKGEYREHRRTDG